MSDKCYQEQLAEELGKIDLNEEAGAIQAFSVILRAGVDTLPEHMRDSDKAPGTHAVLVAVATMCIAVIALLTNWCRATFDLNRQAREEWFQRVTGRKP
jgi:hypothetical protein